MRVPSYRKHSSGQARVTINGKDYLLGPYGSSESKEAYGRLIAEYGASNKPRHFGTPASSLTMQQVATAFLAHAKVYYAQSNEHYQYELTTKPIVELYGSRLACNFSAVEFKAVRAWWTEDRDRSRQYVNKQAQRTLRIIKWATGEGMMPPDSYTASKCVEPLKRGRCQLPEADKVTCVSQKLVDATLPYLTPVLQDMIRFQQLTGCRPGEVCKIKPGMVNRGGDVWILVLAEHKTAYRGKERTIYVGPQAQAVLAPYLLRAADAYCFSPIESERQRRQARHEARKVPLSCGNRPGSNVARKPRTEPGTHYTTGTYGQAIRYACDRGELEHWAPNQLRHSAATAIRKDFGIDAASVILGHSGLEVTQVYAESDRQKAIEVVRQIG